MSGPLSVMLSNISMPKIQDVIVQKLQAKFYNRHVEEIVNRC